jgi:hypothetical protein
MNNRPVQNDAEETDVSSARFVCSGKLHTDELLEPLVGKMITVVLDDITISGEFTKFSSKLLEIKNPQFSKNNDWLAYDTKRSQYLWDDPPGIVGDFILVGIINIKQIYQNNKLTKTEKSIKDIIE